MEKQIGLTWWALSVIVAIVLASCRPSTDSVSSASPATETATRSPALTKAPPANTPTEVPVFRPAQGTLWQWQLDTPIDTSIEAQVYDIDLFDNDASVVSALHAKGVMVICYTSVGTHEDWRPDAEQFPAAVIGKPDQGWEGERWLDIRQVAVLAPIIKARMDMCKAKGFDGLEPDNIDGYTNDTSFPLTSEDQLKYNRWLAEQAHARGLSIGLKNDGGQAAELVNDFDWALTEDCFVYDECKLMKPFIDAGKQVVDTEYTDTGVTLDSLCPQVKQLGIDIIFKDRDLTAFRQTCP